MFTRFSAPPPHDAASIAGAFASLVAHASIVAVALGVDLVAPVEGPPGRGGGFAAPGAEAIHWVGVAGAANRGRLHPGALPPIAYVVPGHGRLRPGMPAPAGPNGGARSEESPSATVPLAPARPRTQRQRDPRRLNLPLLPAMAELDVAVLVPGVLASAIDPERLALRPEDFERPNRPDGAGDPLAHPDVRALDMQRLPGQVDVLPIAVRSNPQPSYPSELARAHVGGAVVVEFMIDSAGTVDLGSLRVLNSTNALFTQAVRSVLPQLRFMPAQLGSHSVGITVRQPFLFRIRAGL